MHKEPTEEGEGRGTVRGLFNHGHVEEVEQEPADSECGAPGRLASVRSGSAPIGGAVEMKGGTTLVACEIPRKESVEAVDGNSAEGAEVGT